MHLSNLQVVAASLAFVTGAACVPKFTEGQANALKKKLSSGTKFYIQGSDEFDVAATRWSALGAPTVNAAVVPGTAEDIATIVQYANKYEVPYLAFNGAHGATTTLGNMTWGLEIYLEQLNSIEINTSCGGSTVTVGGGTNSMALTDTLWAAGKQTVTGTCQCVSYLGPALGGGHGWLQGRHGLVADQFVSADIVLANGTLVTVDESSELMYALKGAGHNFGIVTSVTSKIYDIKHRDWAIETFIFSGDQVEQVYQVANDNLLMGGNQPADVIHWSYWLNNPSADPDKPVIIFYLIQEGVTSIDAAYSDPLRAIGPLSVTPESGDYTDLAAWTGIAMDSPPCVNDGSNNPRFPLYLEEFDIATMRDVYDTYAAGITPSTNPLYNSIYMWESYSNGGVKAISADTAAFAFRDVNILGAPLLSYTPDGAEVDAAAYKLGTSLRDMLFAGSGGKSRRAYVNYSFGDEPQTMLYGNETERQTKLRSLKQKYDPEGKFSFYAPITP